MPKRRYSIATRVERAEGYQFWTVEADSEADALERARRGEAEFDHEEIEVMELGEPECLGEVDADE